MSRNRLLLTIGASLCGVISTQAQALSSSGWQVTAVIPTICNVAHRGSVTDGGTVFGLGQLTEYCNAPGGFALYVNYAPGTLVGTELTVDGNTIVLNGSGRAEITRHEGPKIVTTDITVKPGQNGFDSDFLTFGVDPS